MAKKNKQNDQRLTSFDNRGIRRIWHQDEWFYSVVDICGVLTESKDDLTARKYWNKLAQRLRNESNEPVTFCHRLKLKALDGKFRETDCANTKSILRIIQSIPSPKAEPLKLWLAQVGYDRIKEIENPELAQDRMKDLYEKKGYTKDWIDKRLRGIAIRQNLTDEWKERGISRQDDYAILTAEISKATFGMTPNQYRKLKSLPGKTENLRDHMTDLELIFTMLGEKVTTEISKVEKPITFGENRKVAKRGGNVAGKARKDTEKELGKTIISKENYLGSKQNKLNQ